MICKLMLAIALVGVGPVFAEGNYKSASEALNNSYDVGSVGQAFLFDFKKVSDLYSCELNKFQNSGLLLVRQATLAAIELRKEPLVAPVAVPVTCFSVG